MSIRLLAAFAAVLTLACVPPPKSDGDEAAAGVEKADPDGDDSKSDDADAKAEDEPKKEEQKAEGPERDADGLIIAEPAPPLTEEQERLIAADRSTLTKEERRKRAQALRQKIMQDPKSPGAQSLLEGAAAIRSGEMAVPSNLGGDSGLTVYPPTTSEPSGPEK